MPSLLIAALAAALAPATPAPASVFEGAWRTDPATARASSPPIDLELRAGVLTCRSCRPPYRLEADGAPHPVGGRAGVDASSVAESGARAFTKTDLFKGRVVLKEVFAVAPDGRTAEVDLYDSSVAGAPPSVTRQRLARTAPPPPGAPPVSGGWRLPADAARPASVTETWRIADGRLQIDMGDGRRYFAGLDGRPTPVTIKPGVDAVVLHRLSERVLEEVDLLKGKAVAVVRMTVSPDGRTMEFDTRDLAAGTRSTITARKL